MSGFILMHRKMTEWEWYKDQKTFRLFTHLLLRANYEEAKWRGITVMPGQIITSRSNLAYETGLSEQNIRTAMKNLKKSNDISVSSTSDFTIITIVNWSKYQKVKKSSDGSNEDKTTSEATSKATSEATDEVTTIKENNNLTNKKFNSISNGKRKNGTKLSEDWKPTEKDIAFAKDKGWTNARIENEAANFVEHFTNGNGRKHTRVDWSKSWQTWVRKDYGGNKQPEIWDGMRPRNNANAWEEQERLHRSLANK